MSNVFLKDHPCSPNGYEAPVFGIYNIRL